MEGRDWTRRAADPKIRCHLVSRLSQDDGESLLASGDDSKRQTPASSRRVDEGHRQGRDVQPPISTRGGVAVADNRPARVTEIAGIIASLRHQRTTDWSAHSLSTRLAGLVVRKTRTSGRGQRLRVLFVDRLFTRDPGGRVCGSRPNAPATLREAGMDRSGYRTPSSFCAMDRLPALCEVWRSRRSSSGCSPTRPAASSGGGEPVSIGGCSCSPRASALADRRLLMPAGPGRRRFDADPRDGFGVFGDSFWPDVRFSSRRRRVIARFSTSCTTFSPCLSRPATL